MFFGVLTLISRPSRLRIDATLTPDASPVRNDLPPGSQRRRNAEISLLKGIKSAEAPVASQVLLTT